MLNVGSALTAKEPKIHLCTSAPRTVTLPRIFEFSLLPFQKFPALRPNIPCSSCRFSLIRAPSRAGKPVMTRTSGSTPSPEAGSYENFPCSWCSGDGEKMEAKGDIRRAPGCSGGEHSFSSVSASQRTRFAGAGDAEGALTSVAGA